MPEFFTPPNGTRGSEITMELIYTIPASMSFAKLFSMAYFSDQILEPNPNSVSLAILIACIGFLTEIIGATGPNTSSRDTDISGCTFVRTVD